MRLAIFCSGLGLLGIAVEITHRPGHAPKLNADDGETVLLDGCVTDPPVFSPAREQFTLDLSSKAAIRVSVNLRPDDQASVSPLRPAGGSARQDSAATQFPEPQRFDYVHYLAAQHIYWAGSIGGPSEIKMLPGSCGSRAGAGLFSLRSWALARLEKLYPDDQHTVGLLQATLIGQTNGVERRWTQDFPSHRNIPRTSDFGHAHFGASFTILLILRMFRLRRLQALYAATAASWLYAFIAGMNAPVVRAAAGFSLFLVASFCFRKIRVLNAVAVIGIVYLLVDPDQLFDPSFQLSFLSAAAIAGFCDATDGAVVRTTDDSVKRFDQPGYDPRVSGRAAEWRVELRLLATHFSVGACLSLAKCGVCRGAQYSIDRLRSRCVSSFPRACSLGWRCRW